MLQPARIGYDLSAPVRQRQPGRDRVLKQCGPLAQLVEHWTFNPLVIGSIPIRPTIRLIEILDGEALKSKPGSYTGLGGDPEQAGVNAEKDLAPFKPT